MSASPVELQSALSEIEAFRSLSRCPRVQALLDAEGQALRAELAGQAPVAAQSDGAAPMETDGFPLPTDPVPRPIPAATPPQPPALLNCTASSPVKVPVDITSYGWDQSASYVKVYITVKDCGPGLTPQHCQLHVEARQINLLVHCPSGRLYRLALGNLGGPVTPTGSNLKAKADGSITISLRKGDSSTWSDLKLKEKVKTPKFDKDEDPQAGLMKLMKNLYDEGDDEMKRTISKAFYESQAGKKPSPADF